MNKAAIFLPGQTPFYASLLSGMMKGLQMHGVTVVGDLRHYAEAELLEFCEDYRPNFIFEMNRPRSEIPFLPHEVLHIDWVVDTNGRPINYFQESNITYFFAANWLAFYQSQKGLCVDWLPPGVDPEAYFPQKRPAVCDFSFIGHMPRPWSPQESQRGVGKDNGRIVTFGELTCLMQQHLSSLAQINYHNDFYIDLADSLLKAAHPGCIVDGWDEVLRYDIGCRTLREFNRRNLIDLVLSDFEDLQLYGPENWRLWPRYRHHYQRFLATSQEMREVYQSSTINLHEGVGLHFRVLDCIASGGLLFALSNPYDREYGGIETCLEPGRHFIPFSRENFRMMAKRYLANDTERQLITESGALYVKQEHSWYRRWEKILHDIHQV